jgi:hypothetical protein
LGNAWHSRAGVLSWDGPLPPSLGTQRRLIGFNASKMDEPKVQPFIQRRAQPWWRFCSAVSFSRPTGQWFLFIVSLKENGWPGGPKMRIFGPPSTRAASFAGRTDGLSARTRGGCSNTRNSESLVVAWSPDRATTEDGLHSKNSNAKEHCLRGTGQQRNWCLSQPPPRASCRFLPHRCERTRRPRENWQSSPRERGIRKERCFHWNGRLAKPFREKPDPEEIQPTWTAEKSPPRAERLPQNRDREIEEPSKCPREATGAWEEERFQPTKRRPLANKAPIRRNQDSGHGLEQREGSTWRWQEPLPRSGHSFSWHRTLSSSTRSPSCPAFLGVQGTAAQRRDLSGILAFGWAAVEFEETGPEKRSPYSAVQYGFLFSARWIPAKEAPQFCGYATRFPEARFLLTSVLCRPLQSVLGLMPNIVGPGLYCLQKNGSCPWGPHDRQLMQRPQLSTQTVLQRRHSRRRTIEVGQVC